ncbi:hypothetical protein GGQ68_004173 [Sagittula marina]|uniref:Uncharacterized protein n=1 Tax=Sagittula marina TaxID=943940 RepID=A0A7W6DS49_9RHOB|nr:hypothetical protein [Sulfitobacter alexandrii]MBB3987819.1 hypothetical protein [Sagittula marina]
MTQGRPIGASSFEIYLNKRTQNGRPARFLITIGNRVVAIILHRYLPHKSVNSVSGLRARISEQKAKSHIQGQRTAVDLVGFLISQLGLRDTRFTCVSEAPNTALKAFSTRPTQDEQLIF